MNFNDYDLQLNTSDLNEASKVKNTITIVIWTQTIVNVLLLKSINTHKAKHFCN